MKIYLAGSWEKQSYLCAVRDKIQRLGHEVTSRWLYEKEGDDSPTGTAIRDLEDIDKADALILYFDGERMPINSFSSGCSVEFGYALAKFKALYVVGVEYNHRRPIFVALDCVNRVPDWDTMYAVLEMVV